jgi:hypothetical protein
MRHRRRRIHRSGGEARARRRPGAVGARRATRLGQARKAVDAVQAEVTAQLGEADNRELKALLRKLLTAPPVIRTRRGKQDPDLLEP